MKRCVLVLGGARSGKSRYAEALAAEHRGARVYVATAEAGDAEMRQRILEHRERRGDGWRTVEETLRLTDVLAREGVAGRFILVDCLTLWISNLMQHDRDVAGDVGALARLVGELPASVAIVSNEVGLGIVPDNALARRFRDCAGLANQRIAAASSEVIFMAAGQPLKLKG
ncbi:MAG: bifunctional adenosylcobinamide kinase/adenosylcobinamide-phosphate guanylyltransferase [Pseudomonadota bacterium]|nr:bifunctional adenosylcobinamide kinase/adenosylcobinamide-phosphate guanylyltransferase [Pseudomonadota bacterium]